MLGYGDPDEERDGTAVTGWPPGWGFASYDARPGGLDGGALLGGLVTLACDDGMSTAVDPQGARDAMSAAGHRAAAGTGSPASPGDCRDCVDQTQWRDADGDDCDAYHDCVKTDKLAVDGVSAAEACCVCHAACQPEIWPDDQARWTDGQIGQMEAIYDGVSTWTPSIMEALQSRVELRGPQVVQNGSWAFGSGPAAAPPTKPPLKSPSRASN
jgi:hypothetical protein